VNIFYYNKSSNLNNFMVDRSDFCGHRLDYSQLFPICGCRQHRVERNISH